MGCLTHQNNKPLCLRDEEFSQFGVLNWLFILGWFQLWFLLYIDNDDGAFSLLHLSVFPCMVASRGSLTTGQLWCFGSHSDFKRLNGEEKSFYYSVCTAQNYSPSKGKWSQVRILNHFWTGFETGSRCFCIKHWALSWNQQIWKWEQGRGGTISIFCVVNTFKCRLIIHQKHCLCSILLFGINVT